MKLISRLGIKIKIKKYCLRYKKLDFTLSKRLPNQYYVEFLASMNEITEKVF